MRWALVVALPLVVALALLALLVLTASAERVVLVRVGIGLGVALLGIVLSLACGVAVVVRARARRMMQAAHDAVVAHAAVDRRRFLQRLDHELKNPLMAIRAGLVGSNEWSPAATVQIEAQVERISRLGADLRKLAELETCPLEWTRVDMMALLGELEQLAVEHPHAAGRQLKFTLPQVPWSLPALRADADLLLLAFYNLVDNALKYTRPGDIIEVRALETGREVLIEVADTGPGIAEADSAHVWEDLYRAPATQAVAGSGLGLPLVRAIIARHGGQCTLRSRIDQGTIVSVRLPITQGAL